MRNKFLHACLAAAICLAALVGVTPEGFAKDIQYRTAVVEKGQIASIVSSTGTLNAVVTVEVGSQVSGQIKELLADFNSEVKEDQVIARLDPKNFEAKVIQAEAELAVAKANVTIQKSGVTKALAELKNAQSGLTATAAQTAKAEVSLENARREMERKKVLYQKKVISESEMDEAQSAFEQAMAERRNTEAQEEAQASLVASRQAAVTAAKAQVEYAQAQVKQRRAALSQSRIDLEHTVILSPVNGVVIDRSVDIGQTVAASLQAPTLFTIAQDLSEMQVETDVDEADIGRIKPGKEANFTLDAYPGRQFKGQIEQIRKSPTTVQNVVTYTVIVSAQNPGLSLLPGMTANVEIVIEQRQDALKVANAALRYRPAGTEKRPSMGPLAGPMGPPRGGPGGPQGARLGGAERIKKLAEELDLNKEQVDQIKAVFAEMRDKLTALREEGARPQTLQAQIPLLRQKVESAILTILNPEQRQKFQSLAAARAANPVTPGTVWVKGEDGEPSPVEVMTGISDGNFTEIVRGDLKEGQEVIIGTK